MRGEKLCVTAAANPYIGSPPRARGKEDNELEVFDDLGITPACAGKSIHHVTKPAHHGDHPRVRGEKGTTSTSQQRMIGSPPRARGKVKGQGRHDNHDGITPACAGKSGYIQTNKPVSRDHPRVRGEKSTPTPSAAI